MPLRLAALDLDGTLLDPFGELTPGVCEAVASLQRAGLRIVLCTGRRFRTALPPARQLGLRGAMVVNNGVLVKDVESGKTLRDEFLPPDLFGAALELMRELGPPLVYVDGYHEGFDLMTERVDAAHPYQREYLADNTDWSRVVADLATARPSEVIMLSAMADAESLAPVEERARERFGERVRTHRLINRAYRGHILELLSPHSGKWRALCAIAEAEGIRPEEIAAIGDDNNDVEMLQRCGLGIAMGNAVPAARAAARHVVASNAEGGAIEAIERVLLAR